MNIRELQKEAHQFAFNASGLKGGECRPTTVAELQPKAQQSAKSGSFADLQEQAAFALVAKTSAKREQPSKP